MATINFLTLGYGVIMLTLSALFFGADLAITMRVPRRQFRLTILLAIVLALQLYLETHGGVPEW